MTCRVGLRAIFSFSPIPPQPDRLALIPPVSQPLQIRCVIMCASDTRDCLLTPSNVSHQVSSPYAHAVFAFFSSPHHRRYFCGEKSAARLNLHIDFCRRLRCPLLSATASPLRPPITTAAAVSNGLKSRDLSKGPSASVRPPQTTTTSTEERFTPRNLRARLL